MIDYEAAWHDLAVLLPTRPGWGSKALSAEMLRIAGEHRVSETFLERALRLYGGELVLAAPSTAEAPPSDTAGTSCGVAAVPAHRPIGGHDGYHHHTRRAVAAAEPVI